ncbi:MAG: hypothetical protein ACI4KF_07495 [Huintestinicola sp.]
MNMYDNCRYPAQNQCCPPMQGQNIKSPEPFAPTFSTPPQQSFDTEEMAGSIQKILAENIGEYVLIEFLIGTEMIMRKQGILTHVGTSYVTLYDDIANDFILCDIFSVKFVYFYYPGQRPSRNFNVLPTNNSQMR